MQGPVLPCGGKCKQEETIYQATVTHTNPTSGNQETHKYVGLAATSFYKRHQNLKLPSKTKTTEQKVSYQSIFSNCKTKILFMKYLGKLLTGPTNSPQSQKSVNCAPLNVFTSFVDQTYTL